MSYIDRLRLLGIRSFGPTQREGQALQFFRPVTIIVGANGSGKTTIIEALKFAVTGELPPSSTRGQGFIFDPKLIKETTVKAQIKLRFFNVRDEPMLVVRNMQLTQKSKKAEYKVIDAAIVTKDPKTGKTTSISSRCTDMDRYVPECLGVSKAMLEHVVFCHQEDSDWPLQNDKALKTHFDEIFSSTKYTKAMETINKTRKEVDEKIKKMVADQRVLGERLAQYGKIEKERSELRMRVEMLKMEGEKTAKEKEKIEAEVAVLRGLCEKREKIDRDRQGIVIRMKGVEGERNAAYGKITSLLEESDEEIKTYYASLQEVYQSFQTDLATLEEEKQKCRNQLTTAQQKREEAYRDHMKSLVEMETLKSLQTECLTLSSSIINRYQWSHLITLPTVVSTETVDALSSSSSSSSSTSSSSSSSSSSSFTTTTPTSPSSPPLPLSSLSTSIEDNNTALLDSFLHLIELLRSATNEKRAELETTQTALFLSVEKALQKKQETTQQIHLLQTKEEMEQRELDALQSEVRALKRQRQQKNEEMFAGEAKGDPVVLQKMIDGEGSVDALEQELRRNVQRRETNNRELARIRQELKIIAASAQQKAQLKIRMADLEKAELSLAEALTALIQAVNENVPSYNAEAVEPAPSPLPAFSGKESGMKGSGDSQDVMKEAKEGKQRMKWTLQHFLQSPSPSEQSSQYSQPYLSSQLSYSPSASYAKLSSSSSSSSRSPSSSPILGSSSSSSTTASSSSSFSSGTALTSPLFDSIDTLDASNAEKRAAEQLAVEREVLQRISKKTSDIIKKTNEISGSMLIQERERGTLERKLVNMKEKIKGHEETLEEEINESSAALQRKKENAQKILLTITFYEKFLTSAKEKCKCPLCNRAFVDNQLDAFVKMANSHVEQGPMLRQKGEKELQQEEKKYKSLMDLKPYYDEVKKINNSLPPLQAELSKLRQSKEERLSEVAELKKIEEEQRNRIKKVEKLLSQAQAISNLLRQQEKLRKDVEKEKALLKENENEGYDFEKEDSLESEKAALEAAELEISAKCNELTEAVNKKKYNLLGLKHALESLKQKQSEVDRLSQSIKDKEEKINLISQASKNRQDELKKLKAAEAEASNEIVETEKHQKMKTSQLQKATDEYSEDLRHLENLVTKFQSQVEKCQPSKQTSTLLDEVSVIDKDIAELVAKDEQLSEELNQKRHVSAFQTSLQRNIEDNMEYRKKIKQLEQLQNEIADLDAQLKSPSSELYRCNERLSAAEQKRQEIEKQQTVTETSIQNFTESIARTTEQLKNMHATEAMYRMCSMRLKTTQMARNDLVKFHSALDKALMKYHSVRMAEVNHSIREKWQEIYRGGDIDYIEIKSDIEDEKEKEEDGRATHMPSSATTTTRSRSYTYRVVMFKNDIEMDMRGRCSAGQKGLACLVIRLALAETFCLRCGMVALDEPTTNLDRANIESFAQALSRLVNSLRGQNNFQLIIITHDEEFVRHIATDGMSDYYWRVSKDESGQSRIERCPLRNLL